MREVEIQDLRESSDPHMNKARGHEECKYTEEAHKHKEAWPAQAMNICVSSQKRDNRNNDVAIKEGMKPQTTMEASGIQGQPHRKARKSSIEPPKKKQWPKKTTGNQVAAWHER